jgi:S1-C subfamily serine protease
MKDMIHKAIRLLVVMALLLTSAVAFAQDETDTTDTAVPFVGIRFMEADNGVLVTGIITNTPADDIGLQAGDIITAIDQNDTVNVLNVQDVVWQYDSNATVSLTIDRNGQELVQDVTLMARPDDLFSNPLYVLPVEPSSIGLVVSEFDDNLFVLGTIANSQAEVAGFVANDIITRVDGDDVKSVGDAAIAMSDLSDGDEVEFYVTRGDEELVIRIIIDRRRRRPAPRPRQLNITAIYETDTVRLGYGNGLIEVQALTPAHDLTVAGLRAGDVIIAINGESINNLNNLFADDSIELTVVRDDGFIFFNVPTSVAPLLMFGVDAPQTQEVGEWIGLHEKQVTLGVRYMQLEPNSPYFTNNSASNGAYIAEVIEGLPAAQSGILVGDILISIDGDPITLDIDLRNRIYAHQAGDTVTFEVLRNGEIINIDVTLRVATS